MIVCDKVEKRFGKVVALDGVSLRIQRGERVALIGTNGSGKTSLLRALVGLLRVGGQITIDGIDVARAPERALRVVAYMPQTTPPLEAPVAELVRASCALRGVEVERVRARAVRLGLDLDTIARVRVRDLSGGMKQKLAASLALACDAPILICDEPTASLDAEARDALFTQLGERPADTTLVLCSHRADEVSALVDRVVELREGRVVRDERVRPAESELVSLSRERSHALRRFG